MSRRSAGIAATILATFGIAALTLTTGRSTGTPRIDPWCLACGDAGVTNLLLNIVLFLPLGLGLALGGWPRWGAVLFGFGLSLLVETLQLTILPGRFATLADLLSNTAGAWLGFELTLRALRGERPSRTSLVLRGFLVWVAALVVPAVAGLAFRPSPGAGPVPWFGQWANVLEGMDPFGGTVVDVRLNGTPIPPERLTNREELRRIWSRDTIRFEARVRTGPVPARRALVATIVEDMIGWPAAIWQDGPDATMSLRLGASDLRVRSPAVRLTRGLDYPPETPVVLRIQYQGGVLTASSIQDGAIRETTLPLRVSSAWKMLWPFGSDYRSETRGRDRAWLLGFALLTGALLGAWSLGGRVLAAGMFLAATVPLITHGVIPRWAGLPPSTSLDWVTTAGGVLGGFAFGALIGRRTRRGVAAPTPLRISPGGRPLIVAVQQLVTDSSLSVSRPYLADPYRMFNKGNRH